MPRGEPLHTQNLRPRAEIVCTKSPPPLPPPPTYPPPHTSPLTPPPYPTPTPPLTRLRGPLGGYHPRRRHQVPPPGRHALAPPRDPLAAAGEVLASIPWVLAVWYAVMLAPEAPQPPPQHGYPRAGGDAHGWAWLAVRELVAAWRRRRRVQVVFHAPSPRCAVTRRPCC